MHLTAARPHRTVALAAVLALSLAACGTSATVSPSPAGSAAAGSAAASAAPSGDAPSLTPVPGGASGLPDPVPTRIGTTQTDRGEILVELPSTFPAYPDAGFVEVRETVSDARLAPADAETVAAWYRDAFTERGYAVELSEPLEDGSRVLDAQADLPECWVNMTFRPEDGSTMIATLVAAACANGTG